MVDCDLLAKVYINLIDQREPTLDFQNSDSIVRIARKEKVLYFKKVIKPTSEEIQNHKKYLKTSLKKNFFS